MMIRAEAKRCEASRALPEVIFREAGPAIYQAKYLVLLVSAMGLEPMTL